MDMFTWNLNRPVVFFDIEATGANPRRDRLIDLAMIKLTPDNERIPFFYRVNPGVPIPAESTAIHGIFDADVADAPLFEEIAKEVEQALEGCDLGGYNLIRYDIPLLEEEFLRAKIRFSVEDRKVIDAQRIFHKREPRDLTAALAFYCGEVHDGAHGAVADVEATISVFEGQFEKYADLPQDISNLADFCDPRDPTWVDRTGRLKWVSGDVAINFGKNKGQLLKDLIANDPSFIKWMTRSDFPLDTLHIVREAQEGRYPAPPGKV
jgi:DNA polymerase-3 subunit epsilon